MADNIAITAGSGTTVATDDVGGFHYQRVKVVWGADGAVNDASAAAPLPVTIDGAQLGDIGPQVAANSVSVTPPTDRQNATLFSLAMTVDTAIFASGELIADSQQCNAFFNKQDGAGVINSLTVIDKDNEGAAFYVLVMRTSTSLGTENSAPSITGANLAAGLIGVIPVATTDYISVGASTKVASIQNIGLPVKAVSGTDDIYIGIVNGAGTPDYTASGDLELVFGVLQD